MNRVIVITGATGCGKSGIIEELPENSPIEIINADSRQIYKYMKIGTAAPNDAAMKRFPHHLFGFLDPKLPWSAGDFVRDCRQYIKDIHGRGSIPIIVGGTFFYIRALWDGLAAPVEIDPRISEEVQRLPLHEAHQKLAEVDPARAAQIAPEDEYRVRKSLSHFLGTGNPVSAVIKKGGIFEEFHFEALWVDMDRHMLYDRINKRVEEMFRMGLIAEVLELLKMGFTEKDPGLKTIGYREIFDLIGETGKTPDFWTPDIIKDAIYRIQLGTRHFAKRQLTWFRHEQRLKRIDSLHAVSLISDLIV